ncbi:unnamed protein product [Protopolystoma xenopodis]|uniref:CTLH domain-containing protein n=1 Tax=Protopolystoma xenopodis TaxID=117903 RepID=A0A3S5CCT9_9PLAT|nr:unnamed protein product [Protopolystoma xenopodis]
MMTTNALFMTSNHVNGLSISSTPETGEPVPVTQKAYHLVDYSNREEEMIRLIGQYLCDKGFKASYQQLSKESGIVLEHKSSTDLRHSILDGKWEEAEKALDQLSLVIPRSRNLDEVRFLILEQRFLEHLEANEVMPAVTLLRNRITPMQRNRERVHTLARCAKFSYELD